MRETVFINYANGVHQNDWEQQRRIVSHASRQKRSTKNTALLKENREGARIVLARRSKHARQFNDYPNMQEDEKSCERSGAFRGHSLPKPTCDNALSGLDPFSALPIPMTMAGVDDVLGYLIHSYSATIQPVQRALGSYKETARNYFSAALANPEFFNAMVAMGSSAYEAQMSGAYVKKQSARVLYFRGQALKLLWQKLDRGDAAIDVGTVMAIILLMGMDIAYCEVGPVLMHRVALRRMLKMSPRPESQLEPSWRLHNPKLRSMTQEYLSDKTPSWYLEPGEALLTPYPILRRQPLTYMLINTSDRIAIYENVPTGFQTLADQGDLSVEVLQIVHRITRVVRILDKARNRRVCAAEIDFAETYKPEHEFHECIDCLRRITPSQSSDAVSDGTNNTTIEHVICLALLAFIESVFGCMTYGPLFNSVQLSLAEALQTCELSDYHEDCMTWAQMVAVWAQAIVSGMAGGMSLGSIWTGYGMSQSWNEIQSTLLMFLITEEMNTACEQIWKRAGA